VELAKYYQEHLIITGSIEEINFIPLNLSLKGEGING
jgi:hypothetical protein